jgi:hypothetical protein
MSSAPLLEIHVPISPTPVFFTRIHYLAASMQVYGGPLKDAALIVTVGEDAEPEDLYAKLPWSRSYPIEWRWMERDLYRRHTYFGTRVQRFTYEFKAQHVMMLDADVLAVAPFMDLIEDVARKDAFLGSPAHASPVSGPFTWEALFEGAGLRSVPYVCEHTGFGVMYDDPARRYCPPYFNLGVLVAPARHMKQIGQTIFDELAVAARMPGIFRAQPAVTLAICRHGIPWGLMPLKYNFPNDNRFAVRYPHDFSDMRLLHFLRKGQIDKDVAFQTPQSVYWLFQKERLDGVNAKFLETLRPVHEHVLAHTA